MNKLIASSRYLVIIGTLGLLVAATATFLWGAYNTAIIIANMVSHPQNGPEILIGLVETVDIFLVATTLVIFAASLYELFVAELNLPEWMLAHNLHELKAKLSSMIILIMGGKFLEKLLEAKEAQALMYTGISIAVVSAVLIAFSHFGGKD